MFHLLLAQARKDLCLTIIRITGYFPWVNGKEIQNCHQAIYLTSVMCHNKSL